MVLSALCAPAAAQAGSVAVVQPGGAARTFQLGQLPTDVHDDYTVRGGAAPGRVRVRGTSLEKLLDHAGADLVGVGSVQIGGGGPQVVLSRNQLSAPSRPPVVYADGAAATFLRPSAGASDLNGADRLSAPTLTVRLRKGKPLDVSAKASATKVDPGRRVTFTASARGGAGEQLTYSWYFDDGSARVRGASVRHAFEKPGSYDVLVGVTTPGDDVGVSVALRIRVGEPPKGPDRKGGGTEQSASAPDSGAATGSGSGTPGAGQGGAAGGAAQDSPGTAAGRPDRPRRRPERHVPREGDPVRGTLLTDAPRAPAPAARARAARTGNDADADGGAVPGVAWGLIVTLGLGGAGAAMELRVASRQHGTPA